MPRLIKLMPKPGLIVRDPRTKRPLEAEGRMVPLTTYWLRRVWSGDCIEVKEESEPVDKPQAFEEPAPKKVSRKRKEKSDEGDNE